MQAGGGEGRDPLLHGTFKSGGRHEVLGPPEQYSRMRLAVVLFFVVEVGVGIWEVMLASSWAHWFGVFAGLFAMCVALIAVWCALTNASVNRMFTRMFVFANTLWILFLLLLVAVHLSAPDAGVQFQDSFPTHCQQPSNCVHLEANATANVQADALIVPQADTSLAALLEMATRWVDDEHVGVGKIYGDDAVYHWRMVSFFWGFPDDFFVTVQCSTPQDVMDDGIDHDAMIWVHSESRLGTDDFGVNIDRVEAFLSAFDGTAFAEPTDCTLLDTTSSSSSSSSSNGTTMTT